MGVASNNYGSICEAGMEVVGMHAIQIRDGLEVCRETPGHFPSAM